MHVAPPLPAAQDEERATRGRRRRDIAVAVAGLLLLGAACAWWWASTRAIPEEGPPPGNSVLRGRVRDSAGQPLPGMRLWVSSVGWPINGWYPDPEPAETLVQRAGRGAHLVTTDSRGEFEATRLHTWEDQVRAVDDAWLLWARRRDTDAIELEAQPAYVVLVSVLDERTGQPVTPSPSLRQVVRVARSTHKDSGHGSTVHWKRPVPKYAEAGFDVTLQAASLTHRPAEVTLRFEPGAWVQRADLRMTPLTSGEVGRLRLLHRLRNRDGRPARLQAYAEIPLTGGLRLLKPEYDSDGYGTVEVPVRFPSLMVNPEGIARHDTVETWITWRGSVEVNGGRTTDFTVPFPPAGNVDVTWSARQTPVHIVADDGAGRRYGRDFQVRPLPTSCRFPWLPVGTWRFELQVHDRSKLRTEGSTVVDVVEGQDVAAMLP